MSSSACSAAQATLALIRAKNLECSAELRCLPPLWNHLHAFPVMAFGEKVFFSDASSEACSFQVFYRGLRQYFMDRYLNPIEQGADEIRRLLKSETLEQAEKLNIEIQFRLLESEGMANAARIKKEVKSPQDLLRLPGPARLAEIKSLSETLSAIANWERTLRQHCGDIAERHEAISKHFEGFLEGLSKSYPDWLLHQFGAHPWHVAPVSLTDLDFAARLFHSRESVILSNQEWLQKSLAFNFHDDIFWTVLGSRNRLEHWNYFLSELMKYLGTPDPVFLKNLLHELCDSESPEVTRRVLSYLRTWYNNGQWDQKSWEAQIKSLFSERSPLPPVIKQMDFLSEDCRKMLIASYAYKALLRATSRSASIYPIVSVSNYLTKCWPPEEASAEAKVEEEAAPGPAFIVPRLAVYFAQLSLGDALKLEQKALEDPDSPSILTALFSHKTPADVMSHHIFQMLLTCRFEELLYLRNLFLRSFDRMPKGSHAEAKALGDFLRETQTFRGMISCLHDYLSSNPELYPEATFDDEGEYIPSGYRGEMIVHMINFLCFRTQNAKSLELRAQFLQDKKTFVESVDKKKGRGTLNEALIKKLACLLEAFPPPDSPLFAILPPWEGNERISKAILSPFGGFADVNLSFEIAQYHYPQLLSMAMSLLRSGEIESLEYLKKCLILMFFPSTVGVTPVGGAGAPVDAMERKTIRSCPIKITPSITYFGQPSSAFSALMRVLNDALPLEGTGVPNKFETFLSLEDLWARTRREFVDFQHVDGLAHGDFNILKKRVLEAPSVWAQWLAIAEHIEEAMDAETLEHWRDSGKVEYVWAANSRGRILSSFVTRDFYSSRVHPGPLEEREEMTFFLRSLGAYLRCLPSDHPSRTIQKVGTVEKPAKVELPEGNDYYFWP